MRLPRVVARAALIAALASVVVPAVAGSRMPGAPQTLDESAFEVVDLGQAKTTMTTLPLDPANRSAGSLQQDGVLREPRSNAATTFGPRPNGTAPAARAIVVVQETWKYDGNISWYGPGFWGQGTACGQTLTQTTLGVAHRTLPCGTLVTFRYNGTQVTVPVIDRGPYVSGRTWDLTKAACTVIGHCFTGGGVYYRIR